MFDRLAGRGSIFFLVALSKERGRSSKKAGRLPSPFPVFPSCPPLTPSHSHLPPLPPVATAVETGFSRHMLSLIPHTLHELPPGDFPLLTREQRRCRTLPLLPPILLPIRAPLPCLESTPVYDVVFTPVVSLVTPRPTSQQLQLPIILAMAVPVLLSKRNVRLQKSN